MYIKKYRGFTLAETLITLMIIGVVSALTIPSIIVNYQKHITISKLKEAQQIITNATNAAINQCNLSMHDFMRNLSTEKRLEAYIKVLPSTVEQCNFPYDCMYGAHNYYWWDEKRQQFNYPLEANGTYAFWGTQMFILKNGIIVGIKHIYGDWGYYAIERFTVDINGFKKPNKIGKDIFFFVINSDYPYFTCGTKICHYSVEPYSKYYDTKIDGTISCGSTSRLYMHNYFCLDDCTKEGLKKTCAAKIVKDGWQIKDDYPW